MSRWIETEFSDCADFTNPTETLSDGVSACTTGLQFIKLGFLNNFTNDSTLTGTISEIEVFDGVV